MYYECLSWGKEFPSDFGYKMKYCKSFVDRHGTQRWKTTYLTIRQFQLSEIHKQAIKLASKIKLIAIKGIMNTMKVNETHKAILKGKYYSNDDTNLSKLKHIIGE